MNATGRAPVVSPESTAERNPRQLGYAGLSVAAAAVFVIVAVLDDADLAPHNAALTVSLSAAVLGTVLAVGGLIDYRNARRGRKYTSRVEAKLDQLAIDFRAVRRAHDAIVGQLAAARTVDIQAFREDLRANREYADAVAEGAVKRVREDMDLLAGEVREVSAEVALHAKEVQRQLAEGLAAAAEEASGRYLADMAKSVEIGREIERKHRNDPPA